MKLARNTFPWNQMQSDRDEGRRRTRRKKTRTPLADLTNAAAAASSSSSSSSSLLLLRKGHKPNPKSTPPPSISRVTPVRGFQGAHGGTFAIPTPPPKASESLVDSVAGGDVVACDEPKHSVVPAQYITKGKRPCTTSSCPPVERIRSIRGKLMNDASIDRRRACSVPCEKPKKKQRHVVPEAVSKPILPQDFIEKQRAYFAEVDAFDLPEEVVSESELD